MGCGQSREDVAGRWEGWIRFKPDSGFADEMMWLELDAAGTFRESSSIGFSGDPGPVLTGKYEVKDDWVILSYGDSEKQEILVISEDGRSLESIDTIGLPGEPTYEKVEQ